MIRKNSKWYKILKHIAKEYAVSVRFTIQESCSYPEKNLICVERSVKTETQLISYFFHELAHIINYRKGKFKHYHKSQKRLTKKVLKSCIYTGLRAEKYTDKVGELLMRRHFPTKKYCLVYNDETIKWYKSEWWQNCYQKPFMRLKNLRKKTQHISQS